MKLTKKQAKEIRALKRTKDKDINLTEIPEVVNPGKAFVGRFYRPIKKSLTVRLDADVLEWLRSYGRGYQTRINNFLRNAMNAANSHYMRLATREPEIMRTIGLESKRKGTSRLSSRQINQIIRAARRSKSNR